MGGTRGDKVPGVKDKRAGPIVYAAGPLGVPVLSIMTTMIVKFVFVFVMLKFVETLVAQFTI